MALHVGTGHSKGHLNRLAAGVTLFPAVGSVADYDFKNNRYSGPALSVANASGGYVDDSQGNWTFVAPNTLRRSDKGVLVEGAQTNSIRNNSMQGAVAGTPGSVPTNWQANLNGVSIQVVGTYTVNGVECLRVRFFGTPTGTFAGLFLEPNNAVAALQNQLWSLSTFVAVSGGSLTNVSGVFGRLDTYNSTPGFIASQNGANLTPSGSLTRYNWNITPAAAATAFIRPLIGLAVTSGQPIDTTLDIGWPQLEQWSTSVTTVGGASSPIRTTGTAATRAADVVSATLASPAVTGTMAGVFRGLIPTLSSGHVSLNDGTSTNQYALRTSGSNALSGTITGVIGGAGGVNPTLTGVFNDGARHAYAGAFAANDEGFSVDGGTALTSASGLTNASLPNLRLGGAAGFNPINGYIERLAIYPYRAANSNLQQMSTLANWGG